MMKEQAVAMARDTGHNHHLSLRLNNKMNATSMLAARWKMLPWAKWKVRCVHHGEPDI